MTARTSRADLHCHSTASQVSKLGVQRALGLPECATPPEEVYALAKRRLLEDVRRFLEEEKRRPIQEAAPETGPLSRPRENFFDPLRGLVNLQTSRRISLFHNRPDNRIDYVP